MLYWIALLLTSTPQLEVVDTQDCLEQQQLQEQLENVLEAHSGMDQLLLQVAVTPDKQHLQVDIKLFDVHDQKLLETRTLNVELVDCATLPLLVASIVERRLASLPKQSWPMAEGPDAVARAKEIPNHTVLEQQDTKGEQLAMRLGGEAGLGIGTDVFAPQGYVRFSGATGRAGEMRVLFAVATNLGRRERVGRGFVQSLSARLGIGLAYDFMLADFMVTPQAMVEGGMLLASGVEFDQPQTARIPVTAALFRIVFRTKYHAFIVSGVEIPFVVARLQETGGKAFFQEPHARLYTGLGYAWDLDFF